MPNAHFGITSHHAADAAVDTESGPAPARRAASLTLAAISLGYGVVQLDVTIVNTALNAIGIRSAAASANCNGW